MREFLARWPNLFAWREPRAGPIAFGRLRKGSAAEFCAAAVRHSGVMLVPSTLFDFGDSHLRWGLGRRGFPEGLAALEAYVTDVRR
jgi:aspartate/methionine/tyrosine aminotransferase